MDIAEKSYDVVDVDYKVISEQAAEVAQEIANIEQGEENSPYDSNSILNRSNTLILTKFKATLLESKLLLMALYEAQKSGGTMKIQFTTQQLIDALQIKKTSSVYSQIKSAAVGLSKSQFFYEDAANHRFIIVNLVESAIYSDGVLTIRLTEFTKRHITGLKTNFTPMLMPVLMNFGTKGIRTEKTNYSLRLYELLRTRLYRATEERPKYTFKFLLTDLKLTIGAIDPSDPGIEKAIIHGKALKLSDAELEKQATKKESVAFRRFNQFEERVLRKAQREINSSTDLCFEYYPERYGSSHKVMYIVFTISRSMNMETEEDNDKKLRLIREVERIIREPIKTRDIERILSAAGNDLEKVRNAYYLSKNSTTPIGHLAAWLIAAIREEWRIRDDAGEYPVEQGRLYDLRRSAEAEMEKKQGRGRRAATKNQFNDFEQNTYDFEQLELELLGNTAE